MRHGISIEVEQFIAEAIESVGQLEILFLLYEDPSRTWTVPAVNQKLQSSFDAVEKRLDLLLARGLVERDTKPPPGYRYAPREARLEASVAALKVAYRDYRTAVIEKIYSRTGDRVMDFARAFELKQRHEPTRPV